ncbi:DUF664 domain-containing protein [Streptomyces sp. NPDC002889]|uniref:mycothiol transferase n=1 Tax=Streptomyces sp. NPDC002889 TaxID=3364669 RepID=UPI00367E6B9C
MNGCGVLADAFGRIQEAVHGAVRDLSAEELNTRVSDDANSIAWLVWHLTRVQDDHVADAGGLEQVWLSGWADRFALPFAPEVTGFGQSSKQVAAVRVDSPELLLGYHDAVVEQTLRFIESLDDDALDRVVDKSWIPPVTLGVRLVSVTADDLQHAGQAAFIRGLLGRR